MKKKILSTILVAALITTVFTGCGSKASSVDNATIEKTSEQTDEEATQAVDSSIEQTNGDSEFLGEGLNEAKKIRIAYQPSTGDLNGSIDAKYHWITEEFAKDGIEVEWVSFTYGAPVVEAINSGDIDLGSGIGDTPFITALSNNVPIVAISLSPYDPKAFATVIRKDLAAEVSTAADLKGKKVALPVGSNAHDAFLKELEAVNLTENDVEIINMSVNADIIAALINKDIDAAATTATIGANIAQASEGYILEVDENQKKSLSVQVANSDFAEKNPELVARFVKQILKIQQYAIDNPADAKQAIFEHTETPVEALDAIDRWELRTSFDESVTNGFLDTIDFLKKSELVENEINLENAYSDKYLIEAQRLLTEE